MTPPPSIGRFPPADVRIAGVAVGSAQAAPHPPSVALNTGGRSPTPEQIAAARSELLDLQARVTPGLTPLFESQDAVRVAQLNRAVETSRGDSDRLGSSVLGEALAAVWTRVSDTLTGRRADGLKRELVQASVEVSDARRAFGTLPADEQWNAPFRLPGTPPRAVNAFDSVLRAEVRLRSVRTEIDALIRQLESPR